MEVPGAKRIFFNYCGDFPGRCMAIVLDNNNISSSRQSSSLTEALSAFCLNQNLMVTEVLHLDGDGQMDVIFYGGAEARLAQHGQYVDIYFEHKLQHHEFICVDINGQWLVSRL